MPANKYIQKSDLTQQMLDKLPGIQFSLEQTIRLWWANPNGGWQLTDQGNWIFEKFGVEGHTFRLKTRTARFYVEADRAFQTPYYINRYDVTLYGGREATAIMITGGDIQQYLERYR
jgi:hypothetical protein